MTMARPMSAGLMLLRTWKFCVPVNSAVVLAFWKEMLVPVPTALSVGTQLMTVWPAFRLIVVVVAVVVMPVAFGFVTYVPVPLKLCAAAGDAPTAITVAKARIEQLVRLRRLLSAIRGMAQLQGNRRVVKVSRKRGLGRPRLSNRPTSSIGTATATSSAARSLNSPRR